MTQWIARCGRCGLPLWRREGCRVCWLVYLPSWYVPIREVPTARALVDAYRERRQREADWAGREAEANAQTMAIYTHPDFSPVEPWIVGIGHTSREWLGTRAFITGRSDTDVEWSLYCQPALGMWWRAEQRAAGAPGDIGGAFNRLASIIMGQSVMRQERVATPPRSTRPIDIRLRRRGSHGMTDE